ncbi:ATP-binding cassette sub-family D [Aureococcus anophagefferens]|nr:ATP-binding cassette sub-family D [Aureococcus anophagefferens]
MQCCYWPSASQRWDSSRRRGGIAPSRSTIPVARRGAFAARAPVLFASDGDDAVVEAPDIPVQERLRLFWRLATPYFARPTARSSSSACSSRSPLRRAASPSSSASSTRLLQRFERQDQAVFAEKTLYYAVGSPSRQYYSDQAYYKVELERDIDNPDQRLTEDVTAFTKVSLDFFITLMTAAIDLVSFSGILYSIYPNLFYAIFVYAGVGSFTTVQLGRRSGQNAEQLLREAGPNSNLQLDFNILPVLVVSPLYFAGTIELGVITQSTGAFNHVLNDLSIIAEPLGRIADSVDLDDVRDWGDELSLGEQQRLSCCGQPPAAILDEATSALTSTTRLPSCTASSKIPVTTPVGHRPSPRAPRNRLRYSGAVVLAEILRAGVRDDASAGGQTP